MDTNAWKRVSFTYPARVPTMISAEEKQYLYWLGRDVWSGEGSIVEIGPWLGGSTVCLAAGMRASGRSAAGMLKVYDNFIWRSFMAEFAPLNLAPGSSFHEQFLENVKEYDDIIASYARALPDEEISGDGEASAKRFLPDEDVPIFDGAGDEPIEILFIDGAKSWRGMRHLMRTVNARLIPGRSLLVCQDFKYWGTYWVPIMMAALGDHIEPAHLLLGSTTVTFRLTKPIPADTFSSGSDHIAQVDRDHALECIDSAIRLLSEAGDLEGAAEVRLGRVAFLAHHGDTALAIQAFRETERHWPLLASPLQLERARRYLCNEKGATLPRAMRLQPGRVVRRLQRLSRQVGRRVRAPA